MCLIVHKPAGTAIPHDLLVAAASLNGDGWGAMGHDVDGRLILERHPTTTPEALIAAELRLRNSEIALHLRRRTRGRVEAANAHPFEVDGGVYLMHNGNLPIAGQPAGHSDTRHLAERMLRPLAQRHFGLLANTEFLSLFEMSLSASNKVVLYDHPRRRFSILNRRHGVEFEGLWLSSVKWIDRALLPLTPVAEAQQRTWKAGEVAFL
ncbi:MAG TPA: class II glutamine amidotransferase [Nevskiaceae bacterium]|nr:class II glutamine amidotransferase [Nevskiaceae bacterium]